MQTKRDRQLSAYERRVNDVNDFKQLYKDPQTDPDMRLIYERKLAQAEKECRILEKKLGITKGVEA